MMKIAGKTVLHKPFANLTDIILNKANEVNKNEESDPIGIQFADYGPYRVKSSLGVVDVVY